MRYDWEFWGGRPPMTLRIYVMWALGNLAVIAIALGWIRWALEYLGDVMIAIWEDGKVQEMSDVAPVAMREPGWVLREYRTRLETA